MKALCELEEFRLTALETEVLNTIQNNYFLVFSLPLCFNNRCLERIYS